MDRRFVGLFVMILLAIALSACNLTTSTPLTPAPGAVNEQTAVALRVEQTVVALQATMQAGTHATPAPGTQQQPQAQASAIPPSGQSTEPTGSIMGDLSFPSGGEMPALRIIAFEVAEGQPTGQYYYIDTNPGQTAYLMTQLPATSYFVIAYTLPSYSGAPMAAGYTQAVPCGQTENCTDHSLIPVQVNAGQEAQGINPTDWSAPPETYPNDPVG